MSDPSIQNAIRTPPRDLQRVLVGYLATALALLCGVPVLVIGWFAASRCTGEGFRCLGWFIYGMLGAAAVAAIALPVLAYRFRLGLWCGLLTLALVAVPLVLGDGSLTGGTAFLGPGLAAWVSQPRAESAVRHWAPRLIAVTVLSILIPLLGRAF